MEKRLCEINKIAGVKNCFLEEDLIVVHLSKKDNDDIFCIHIQEQASVFLFVHNLLEFEPVI